MGDPPSQSIKHFLNATSGISFEIVFDLSKTGEMRGIAIGEKTGESRLGALISAMTQAGEGLDAVTKVSTDPEYRKKMYLKYTIA